ncbi:MAG: 6-bladed beta-propeller [Candidatus Aminicenantes bacterium]|nr:6-bladed beta-propeller [Candidatus Aminicenantes bacterium]
MKKGKVFYIFFLYLLFIIFYYSCMKGKEKINEVINKQPIYKDYVDVKKLFDIDVTQINIFSKEYDFSRFIDFDKNHNLYILDSYSGTIWVFDTKNGKLINKFGKIGQGPSEFEDANRLVIKDDKLFVFQGFFGLKILSLNGNYISQQTITIENPLVIKAVGDKFFLLTGKTDRTFTNLELILREVDESFSGGKEVWRYKCPLGLKGPVYWEWLYINKNGNFYYPKENLDKYLISKYDRNGHEILRFGRDYELSKYSQKAKEEIRSYFKKAIESGQMIPLESPPIVRNIFEDLKENIWVVSGETFEDNLIPEYENTVDIFDKAGRWLCNFKTKLISKNSFFDNGKIFRLLPINPETYDQFLEVYEIKYLAD